MKCKECIKSINDESWNCSSKILSVWIICRVLMALVRIFIINIWGQCESGISVFKPMGLHWGHIFEGFRMETNWDLHTLLMRAEWRPRFSFCFYPLLHTCLCALTEKSFLKLLALQISPGLGAHMRLWWQHPSHLKQRQQPVKPASWNAGLTELQDIKKMQNNAIPNLSKRRSGWDGHIEMARN